MIHSGVRITGSNVIMKKLLEMWHKRTAHVRRRVGGANQGQGWMKNQLSKMDRLNQKVISASMGR